jgi:hypothetical protein
VSRRVVLCLILLAALAVPALARASAYSQVLAAYQRDGAVPACKFSSHTLSAAVKQEDTYGAQYFADFTNSIEAALESRASGQCSSGSSQAVLPPSGSGRSSASGSGLRLGPLTAATDAGLPAPIALMALIALAVAVVVGGGVLARLRGWDPAWAAAWRHAGDEAGYRLSAIWADLADRLRSRDRRHSV